MLHARAAFAQSIGEVREGAQAWREDWRHDGGFWEKVREKFLLESRSLPPSFLSPTFPNRKLQLESLRTAGKAAG